MHRQATLLSALALLLLSAAALPAAAQPSFSKAFQPDTIGPGSISELVFTVDNPAGVPVEDLAFTDVLPAGVIVASPASPDSTCGGTLTAPDGGGTVTLSGGSVGALSSCQVRVGVTSSTPGVHMNVSGDLTSDAGNSGSATADLTVDSDLPGFSKSFSPSAVQLGGRSTLTFVLDNSASSTARTSLSFSDTLPSGLVVAGPSNASTDCPVGDSGSLTAVPGTDLVAYASGINAFPQPPPTLAAGATCTVTVEVVAEAGGLLVNRSGDLTSSTGGPSVSSGFAVAALQVDVDELALRKSFIDDPVSPGAAATLRFTLTNFNRFDGATGITFTDDLDATLSGMAAVPPLPADPCGAGSTLSGTSALTLAGGNLGPGETCTFDVTLLVPAAAAPGAYPNTTSAVTGDVGGVATTGAAAADTLFVQPVPVLTKTFLDPDSLTPIDSLVAGDDVVMEFTVTNSSATFPATDVEFSDNLSQFLSGVIVTALPPVGACGAGSFVFVGTVSGEEILSLVGGNLAAGGSCTFQVDLTVPDSVGNNTYTNLTSEVTATVDGDGVTGPPASADLTVLAPPSLLKSFLSASPPGGTVDLQFTLALSENAPGPATGISFTDDLESTLAGLTAIGLPADGFCGPGSQVTGVSLLTVSGASLDPGESCTFTATLQVPADALPGDYPNTTSQLSATLDGTVLTGTATSSDLRVLGLQLLKSFPDSPAVAGGTATLQFTLDNTASPLAASDISFSDDLGDVISGMTATSLPMAGFCGGSSQIVQSGDVLNVVGASVPAGATCTFSVTVQVPAGTPSSVYTNLTSQVSATLDGSTETVPPAFADLAVIDPLAISKSFVDDPVAPGETVTLELTLSNSSPTDSATGLTFTDDLDAALSGLTATAVPMDGFCGMGSQATGGGVLTVTGAELAPSSSCTFQVTVLVPAGAAAGTTVVNTTSELTGNVGGVAATAPPASDVLRIDLVELTKGFASPVGAGGTVVLSFQVENRSVTAIDGLGFTDDLDATLAGLAAVALPSAPCGAGSTITGTSLLVFSGGSLDAGATCSFDVTVQVPAGAAPGLYPNTTSELTSQGQPLGTAATAELQVEPPPAFAKAFSPPSISVLGTSSLVFTIDNSASVLPADNLAFTDTLPAGLVVADPAGVSNGCGGTFTGVSGAGSVSLGGGSVAAGATCTVEVDVAPTASGSFVNVSGPLTSSLGDSGTATAALQVLGVELDFAKEFGGSPSPGGTVDLTFFVTNLSDQPVGDLAFSDDLDAVVPGLEAEGLPLADVCGAGSQLTGTSVIALTGGSLPGNGACSFTVTVRLPLDLPAGELVNTTGPITFQREGTALVGPAASAVLAVNVLDIPTLSWWGLLLLAGLIGVMGWLRLR